MDNHEDEQLLNDIDEQENLDSPSASSLDTTVTPDTGSTLSNFGATIAPKKAIAGKKVLAFLLKKPWFWIALGGVIFFFIVVLSIFNIIDFDFYGVGHVNPEYYAQNCNHVYLAWENEEYIKEHEEAGDYEEITDPLLVDISDEERFSYKTLDFNTYVGGVVWTDNKNANILNNEVVYQAMSIIARSYLFAVLPDNCVVLRDYNPQNYTELSGSEEHYAEIMNGVTATNGVIIGREGEPIKAEYDAFSYVEKYKEENEDYKDRGSYYMMNVNETGKQVVPADWVEEFDIPKKKVPDYKRLSSFSLYGAKHLLEKVYSQYGVYRVLEYYYGRDIEYYKISIDDASDFSTNCSEFSLATTTLGRDEFISKVNAYNNSNSTWRIFQQNAGTIYDIAVQNNVNPEIIIVRGILEGFSPGGSTHNYFGINCTNTGNGRDCRSYSSFDDGILGMVSVLQGYSSFLALCQRYAYLGDYWYNPGSSGQGGCYYAEYIYPNGLDSYVSEACGVSHNGCSGSSCVATREEDRNAYALYQGKNMTELRYKIFGISEDSCANNTLKDGSCVIYNQSDARWKSSKLGNSNDTISRSGCAVTSVAIALTCTGKMTDVTAFSPLVLNNALVSHGGFSGASIYWDNSAIRQFVSSFHLGSIYDLKNVSNSTKIDRMNESMGGNRIGIVHIVNSNHLRGHFVVLKSIDQANNTFQSLDPAGGKIQTYSIDDVDNVKFYTY